MEKLVNSSKRLQICIVGGSIAGCAIAIQLMRAGHYVTVFERSPDTLQGRGAGIGTSLSVLQSLIDRNLIDADMPYFHVEGFPHIGRTTATERLGRTAWTVPIATELLNWGDLYRNLRKRVPDRTYHSGCEVTSAWMADQETVIVQLADGRKQTFNLVIFADGYQSRGRQLLFPDVNLQYRGYVLWRGILEESNLNDSKPLEGLMNRVGHPQGYCVFYFVPGQNSSVAKGERWINWACYLRVPAEALPHFLTDRTGRVRTHSIPPGTMRLEEETQLKQWASNTLPPYFSDIINASQNTFAQPVFIAEVPAYYRGRIGLIGDAGTCAPPLTGSGVFKGMNNAIDLADALLSHKTIHDALEVWSMQQTQMGKRMIALGQQMEKALIWSIPNFSQMDETAMRNWWQESAKLPEEMYPSTET
jgi:2-polyprenyl-6-methoxyphenol hydroxylase-like FAD-dependent oxidoreductase